MEESESVTCQYFGKLVTPHPQDSEFFVGLAGDLNPPTL